MTAKKTFYIMIASLVISVILLGSVVFVGNLKLKSETDDLVDLKATNQTLETQQTNLITAQRNLEKYSDLEEITQDIVPQDKDQARAVREIVTLAEQSGFGLESITFPQSNLGSSSSSDKKKSSTDTISQALPVQGIKGVYSLEAVITPKGNIPYSQFLDFLSKLENNRRTAQVTSVRIEPSTDGNSEFISFTLNVNLFLKP